MRAVSRMYDEFLRDAGLNITQFWMLRLISVPFAIGEQQQALRIRQLGYTIGNSNAGRCEI